MARGKLPAADEFHDGGYRFRRLKRGERGKAFSILVRMPADDDHETWWWSKPKKITLTKANDKTELLQLADAYREDLERGANTPVTISVYIERWKKRRALLAKAGKLKQSTIDREATTLQHAADYIGGIALHELTAQDIETMYRHMDRDGVSISTQARVHRRLHYMLEQAYNEGLLVENPTERVSEDAAPSTPKRDEARHDERTVTIDEADALLQKLRAEPPDGLRTAVWLAYTLGLRRGECLGLKWSDIDETAMKVTIDRQMTRHGETSLKTPQSRRTLYIETHVLQYLQEWKEAQRSLYKQPLPVRDKEQHWKLLDETIEATWSDSVYVCSNADGGTWIRETIDKKKKKYNYTFNNGEWRPNGTFNRSLRHFFVSHGLGEWVQGDDGKRHYHGATLHSLRHTYATTLVRDGVDIRTAQALMGHASPVTTMAIYVNEDDKAKREAAAAFAKHVMTDNEAHEAWIEEMEG